MHLSRRLSALLWSCVVRPSVVNFSHFRLLLWNHWTEFNETWQEARTKHPLPSLCFSGRSEKQDGRPGLWLAETFSTSPLKLLKGIKQTWQEARSQCPLPSLCFSGRLEKQDGRPGLWLAETFSTSAERNSTKLDRKQDLNALYASVFFRLISKQKCLPWSIP